MTNSLTLDQIREESRRRYAPVTIEIGGDTTIELTSLLRLSKKDRESVLSSLDELKEIGNSEEDGDLSDSEKEACIDTIASIFKKVAKNTRSLLDAIEDDEVDIQLATMTEILNIWLRSTQLGEARNSPA